MRAKMLEWHSVLRESLIRTEKQGDYDENWVEIVRNAALMLTTHHLRLCLIQIAHITSLQKIRLMRKCGY